MIDLYFNAYQWEIGSLISRAANDLMSAYEYDGVVTGPFLIEAEGCRGVHYEITDGDRHQVTRLFFPPLLAGQVTSARILSQVSGVGMSDSWGYYPGVGGSGWDDLINRWLDYKVGLVSMIAETWCGATVEAPVFWQTAGIGTHVRAACALLQVLTPMDALAVVFNLVGTGGTDVPLTYHNVHGPERTLGAFNITSAGNERQIDRIASAAEDIAMSRIEVSANNGDSMFNVVGGSRIETGAEEP